jgi:hypothetical protein
MTTYYRTPDVVVDAHEWHVVVWRKTNKKVTVSYRWRPLIGARKWLPISTWQGAKPKALWRYFAKYRAHIEIARECETNRRQAILQLAIRKTPPSDAMVRNAA